MADAPALRSALLRLAGAIACTLLATALALAATRPATAAEPAMVLLLGVLASGALFGLRPALVCAGLSALAMNLLFLEPRLTLAIARPRDVLTFAVFFAAAMATGWLSGRARDQAQRAEARRAETLRLLAATRRLAAAPTAHALAQVLARESQAVAATSTAVLLGGEDDLCIGATCPADRELDPLSLMAARWSVQRGEPSGATTEVSSGARWLLLPLPGVQGPQGVLALLPAAGGPDLARLPLLTGLREAAGLALERRRLADAQAENEVLRQTDRLRTALFDSLSHDLRTPLAGILGSATTLLDFGERMEPAVARDLLDGVREQAERLNGYIGELLDLSRLRAGALAPRLEVSDLHDVLEAAARRIAPRLAGRELLRERPQGVAGARVDPVLLEQALVNVLENACLYAPADLPIRLCLVADGAGWRVLVEDRGPGVPFASRERVFEPFVRLDEGARAEPGSGLGLAVARGFVEAMGGSLAVERTEAQAGGARFAFRLPGAGPAT